MIAGIDLLRHGLYPFSHTNKEQKKTVEASVSQRKNEAADWAILVYFFITNTDGTFFLIVVNLYNLKLVILNIFLHAHFPAINYFVILYMVFTICHIEKQRHYFANKGPSSQVFPVVRYGCESWTVKKAEHRRIDAFEVWCWRWLLRVPGLQGDPTSPFWRRSALGFLWKECC